MRAIFSTAMMMRVRVGIRGRVKQLSGSVRLRVRLGLGFHLVTLFEDLRLRLSGSIVIRITVGPSASAHFFVLVV